MGELSMEKKMIFINYCPDDQWTGCSILNAHAELAYRRIQDLIYINDNKLLDEDVTWEQITRGFVSEAEKIKQELLKKEKITISDDYIRNKRCSAEIEKAKSRHDNAKKGAESRWAYASHKQTTNHNNQEPLTTNHNKYKDEVIIFNYFNEFWELVTNKVSKGQALKNYKKLDKDWLDKPKQLAEMYNEHYNSQTDKTFAKQPAFWLSAEKYLDERPKEPTAADVELTQLESWVEKFKNPTPFAKDYAKKHKGFVEKMVEKGMITEEDVKNLYL
tara:strand:+ start:1328 stop:2149 length:822 start_codon:yes stop_codon:yes gene_type:complete